MKNTYCYYFVYQAFTSILRYLVLDAVVEGGKIMANQKSF